MGATNILDRLAAVGLSVSLIEGDRLLVCPKGLLTDELRSLIRAQREAIVAALKPVQLPEPPSDPAAWHELAAAYHAHHFGCKTCQAAGRGVRYGQRCGAGTALWAVYQKT